MSDKKLIYTYHTIGTINDLKDKINLIYKVVDIVVQILFLFYYGYLIYSNLDRLAFLIIYSIVAGISLIYFIFRIIVLSSRSTTLQKQVNPKMKIIVKIMKYILRVVTLVFVFIEIYKFGVTEFQKLITIGSIVALILDIIVLLLSIFISHYIDMIVLSIKMDYEQSKLPGLVETFGNPKGKIYETLDKPLEYLANKKTGEAAPEPVYTAKEQKMREQINNRKEQIASDADTKKIEKKNKEKGEIVTHLKTIFSRKKKQ